MVHLRNFRHFLQTYKKESSSDELAILLYITFELKLTLQQ